MAAVVEEVVDVVADVQNCTPDEVMDLVTSPNPRVRSAAASSVHLSSVYLVNLAHDINPFVRNAVASNPNTPASVLTGLADDLNCYVREAVAGNPNASQEVLRRLSRSDSFYLQMVLAGNPSSPADVLELLSKNESARVRCEVAGNLSTPVDVLVRLSSDEAYYVLKAVAENVNTPASVLIRFIREVEYPHDKIRNSAIRNTSLPVDTFRLFVDNPVLANSLRKAACSHPDVTVEMLREIAPVSNSLAEKVALSPNADAALLDELSRHVHKDVRFVSLRNRNMSIQTVRNLLQDREPKVMKRAMYTLSVRGYAI